VLPRDGQRLGEAEGRALGVQKGFEIGHEVGYYAGCTQVWRQLQRRHPEAFTARADKAIAAIEDLVQDFPLDDPQVGLANYSAPGRLGKILPPGRLGQKFFLASQG
jgi:hypothetical protein